MQRASIPALARRSGLGVDVEWVVFGPVHRLGPLDGTRPSYGAGRAAGRASCAAGRGGTSRSWSTAQAGRIRTGPAAWCW
jgi:hypothetical protein